MFTARQFSSASPNTRLILAIEPASGALRCKLVEQKGDKQQTVIFILASPRWLADELERCLKANARHKDTSIRVNFTWTDSNNGFNYHLTKSDTEQLLTAIKETL